MPTQPVIRPGRDSDGPALIALIWACWSAYPGIRLDVDKEMPELHALATYYKQQGGALWVSEAERRITGMIATRPAIGTSWEICRVYVDPPQHGSGLGHQLLDHAEHHAIASGAERLILWSDTRFNRAHRFYEKRSYVRHGAVRVLNDISNSLEFGYAKPVNGIEALNIAAAESAETRLSQILIACVETGASVSFLAPLHPAKAKAFWQNAASQVGAGTRIILAGWRNGELVATGMLDLATPENQQHRAEIQKLLVYPSARRTGLGRQIMRALEAEAVTAKRWLLTLDTKTGDAAESLYRSENWQEAGCIPDFAIDTSGQAVATVLFYKRLPLPVSERYP